MNLYGGVFQVASHHWCWAATWDGWCHKEAAHQCTSMDRLHIVVCMIAVIVVAYCLHLSGVCSWIQAVPGWTRHNTDLGRRQGGRPHEILSGRNNYQSKWGICCVRARHVSVSECSLFVHAFAMCTCECMRWRLLKSTTRCTSPTRCLMGALALVEYDWWCNCSCMLLVIFSWLQL